MVLPKAKVVGESLLSLDYQVNDILKTDRPILVLLHHEVIAVHHTLTWREFDNILLDKHGDIFNKMFLLQSLSIESLQQLLNDLLSFIDVEVFIVVHEV